MFTQRKEFEDDRPGNAGPKKYGLKQLYLILRCDLFSFVYYINTRICCGPFWNDPDYVPLPLMSTPSALPFL